MAEQKAPQMQATLGLTGLTSNAMALIAPGAFLWLTFVIQAATGTTSPSMWIGIFAALLLCLATAVAYAEISKLYPGTGSSYYYAEQAMLSKDKAFKYARVAKFVVGWGSHLYYWVYPGVMVAVTGIFVGYVVGFLYPNFLSGSNPGPVFMGLIAVVFSFFVAWIASKGAGASTAVNIAINIVQISALVVFSVLALGYRSSHPSGTPGFQYDGQTLATYTYQFATNPKDGSIMRDANGTPLPLLGSDGKPVPFQVTYPTTDSSGNFLTHPNAASVVGIHKLNFMFIQATVAILILVGFESVTSMGGEAKNPTKHIPIAVIASLLIQGLFCYLFEYFCANYFLNSGYTMQSAVTSAAPIGDMMIMVGDALLGQGNGKYFMLIEAFTVFLALIGTTLACMNTGARVTYAMGKDDEAPEHFGMLHAKSLSPRRAIWTLAVISAVIGVVAVSMPFSDASAPSDASIAALPHGIFSSFGYSSHATMAAMPNSLLAITLTSNFGTFILYALSCLLCIVAYNKRPDHNVLTHTLIPGFGLLANVVCMAFYLISPIFGLGTFKEPLLALAISAIWGLYGGIYFMRSSKAKGKAVLLTAKQQQQVS
ncbi:Amino acid permease-associated region [Candidatus Sulfotelmatomonas gaucii]|uniref:Amino acid permease-associated region n=1 Tax=Candidatus Sulfuritelmatomonas gaucii TaxID=2043161 RepID=A0A2N9LM94_9BACT|nr:Amino acid permease-associated region [Candidatus Sulfotelmatomonas gaucii]